MFNIMGNKKYFFGASTVIILISLISFFTIGMVQDVDFAGGVVVTFDLKQDFDQSEAEGIILEALGEHDVQMASVQKEWSVTSDVLLTVKYGYTQNLNTADEREQFTFDTIASIQNALKVRYDEEAIRVQTERNAELAEAAEADTAADTATDTAVDNTEESNTPEIIVDEGAEGAEGVEGAEVAEGAEGAEVAEGVEGAEADSEPAIGIVITARDVVSPQTGRELTTNAIWMSILTAIIMLVYISIRFEFVSGVTTVIALVHNVVFMIGAYSILRVPISTSFIAAILAVLGYSINDTIVIFDRIRENARGMRKMSFSEVAENSIWQSMTRSINTSFTTLITLILLYIMGVPSIKEFAFPIMLGVICGAYTSIFIAGPLWGVWKDAGRPVAVNKR